MLSPSPEAALTRHLADAADVLLSDPRGFVALGVAAGVIDPGNDRGRAAVMAECQAILDDGGPLADVVRLALHRLREQRQ